MLESQGIVSGECLKVCRREVGSQDTCSQAFGDQAVMERRSGMAQGEQRLGFEILLQQDIIDRWKSILQVTECLDVRTDPLSDIDNGSRILDDIAQLLRDDLVDDGIDQPEPPAEPIEDRRLAHLGGRGDILERRREPLLPKHLNRSRADSIDVSAGIRAESRRTTGVGHDEASFRMDN